MTCTRFIAAVLAAGLFSGAAQADEAGFTPRTEISELGGGATPDIQPDETLLAELNIAGKTDETRRAGPLKMPGRGFTPPSLDAPLSPALVTVAK